MPVLPSFFALSCSLFRLIVPIPAIPISQRTTACFGFHSWSTTNRPGTVCALFLTLSFPLSRLFPICLFLPSPFFLCTAWRSIYVVHATYCAQVCPSFLLHLSLRLLRLIAEAFTRVSFRRACCPSPHCLVPHFDLC